MGAFETDGFLAQMTSRAVAWPRAASMSVKHDLTLELRDIVFCYASIFFLSSALPPSTPGHEQLPPRVIHLLLDKQTAI